MSVEMPLHRQMPLHNLSAVIMPVTATPSHGFYHFCSGTKASLPRQSGNVIISLPSSCSVFNNSCSDDKIVVCCMKVLSGNGRMVILEEIVTIFVVSVSTSPKFTVFTDRQGPRLQRDCPDGWVCPHR